MTQSNAKSAVGTPVIPMPISAFQRSVGDGFDIKLLHKLTENDSRNVQDQSDGETRVITLPKWGQL